MALTSTYYPTKKKTELNIGLPTIFPQINFFPTQSSGKTTKLATLVYMCPGKPWNVWFFKFSAVEVTALYILIFNHKEIWWKIAHYADRRRRRRNFDNGNAAADAAAAGTFEAKRRRRLNLIGAGV